MSIILILLFGEIISSFIYLGVEGYGDIDRTVALNPESEIYRFLNNNEEKKYKIYPGDIINTTDTSPDYDVYKCEDGAYPIQNKLIEGYEYDLTIENNYIIDIKQITKIENKYTPPIKNTPGLKTLKNFISTAFQPLGTTLYVFGGGWDFQDLGTAYEGRTIGISSNWVKFFDDHNENYTYRDDDNKTNTYYPFGGFNEYYYAGLDCSGFVGWSIYNNLYKTSLTDKGFVRSASNIAKNLAENNYGKWMHNVEGSNYTNPNYILLTKELKVGDILSTNGHVMIVLGKCNDGSFIIIHSTPNKSKANSPGGGVQISAVNPNGNNENCEAYKLCEEYTKKYFKKWSERYDVIVVNVEKAFNFDDEAPNTGIFHWDLNNGIITDPDNYSLKTAKEILNDLFEKKEEEEGKEEKEENPPSSQNGNNTFLFVFIGISILFSIIIIIIIIIIIKKNKNKNIIENNEEGIGGETALMQA